MENHKTFLCIIIVFLTYITSFHAENLHKVHNINLYPDRYAWCDARTMKMVVGHEGCESHIIDNKVCVGQCFSYTVPETIPKNIFDARLTYCDSCRPSNYTWIKIEMFCKDPDDPSKERILEKRLQVVQECACSACPQTAPEHVTGSDVNRKTKLDVPELLDEQQLHEGVTGDARAASEVGAKTVIGNDDDVVNTMAQTEKHKNHGHRHKKHTGKK